MFEEKIKEIEDKIFQDDANYVDIVAELNSIIREDSRNLRALEFKYFALYASENYAACVPACNKVVEIDPTNIDALNFKASALFRLDKMDECIDVCDRITCIESQNQDAADLKEKAITMKMLDELSFTLDSEETNEQTEENKPKMDLHEQLPIESHFNVLPSVPASISVLNRRKQIRQDKRRGKNLIFRFILYFIIPVALIFYLQPVSETMKCNGSYSCRIDHTFLGNIHWKQDIQLLPTIDFSADTYRIPLKLYEKHNTYAIYTTDDGKDFSPFIYYTFSSVDKSASEEFVRREKAKLEKYKANPKLGYFIASRAGGVDYTLILITYLLFALVLFIKDVVDDFKK
jgi:tetratricopeptide (TPR) repeat protein